VICFSPLETDMGVKDVFFCFMFKFFWSIYSFFCIFLYVYIRIRSKLKSYQFIWSIQYYQFIWSIKTWSIYLDLLFLFLDLLFLFKIFYCFFLYLFSFLFFILYIKNNDASKLTIVWCYFVFSMLPRYATGHYMTQCSLLGTLMAQKYRVTTTPEL